MQKITWQRLALSTRARSVVQQGQMSGVQLFQIADVCPLCALGLYSDHFSCAVDSMAISSCSDLDALLEDMSPFPFRRKESVLHL